MAFRRLLRGVGAASFALAGLAVAKDAVACSCAGGVKLNWPETDAMGVELDSPIVVSGEVSEAMFGPPTLDAGSDGGQSNDDEKLVLVSATDDRVWLTPLTSAKGLLCAVRYRFTNSNVELSPNTRYELRHGQSIVASFTTGTQRRDVQAERLAAEALAFEVLGTLEDPTQITTAFVTNVGPEPLYLTFTGSVEGVTQPTRYSAAGTIQLNFGSVVCPEVRILGAAGDTLVTKVFCAADRCLKSNGIFSQSTCGGNYAVDIDYQRFRALPLGCESTDVDTADESEDASSSARQDAAALDAASRDDGDESDAAVNQGEPQKIGVETASSGCAVPRQNSRSFDWVGASFVVLATWLARRR